METPFISAFFNGTIAINIYAYAFYAQILLLVNTQHMNLRQK